jgi:hypothetical protein
MDLAYKLRRTGLLQRTRGSRRGLGEDAVVFSSYVPNVQALLVAKQFLEVFRGRFADCDFFVGINAGSLPEWEVALRESGLRKMRIGNVSPELVVDSDVAGFQQALDLMRREGKEYRLVWMGHTKGVTANHPELRSHLIERFYLDRDYIARMFDDPRVGSFGYNMTIDQGLAEIDARMDSLLFRFPYRGIGTFYLHTFYVLRGSIVKQFLDGCTEEFFARNLVSELGFDRYFFERDFSRLADKFGYYPVYRMRHQHMSAVPVTRETVRALYQEWERQLPASMRTTIRFR